MNNNNVSPFNPPWWLRNAHAQTLWASVMRHTPDVCTHSERLELADGDFLDLSWTARTPALGPIVIVLHGLTGSAQSKYAGGLLHAIQQRGWRGVLMHFRGCSGVPNRLPRFYHAGETGDLNTLINTLRQREPGTPLAVVGYSLGGNVVLKWLAEQREHAPVFAAVAVSVPFSLSLAAQRLNRGFSRLYQWLLLHALLKTVREKFAHMPSPIDLGCLPTPRSIEEYDDRITAPLHGFKDVQDYYAKSSSRQYLKNIRTPTLILHAADDPFMTEQAIPDTDELSDSIRLELSRHGGHVGFITGRYPWRAVYWLEQRITGFLDHELAQRAAHAARKEVTLPTVLYPGS